MAHRQREGRANVPSVGPGDQRPRVQAPALAHQTQIDHPLERPAKKVIGLVRDVIQQGVFVVQAAAADLLQHRLRCPVQDLLLTDGELRHSEPPVHLETASVRTGGRHFELAVLFIPLQGVIPIPLETPIQSKSIRRPNQEVDVGQLSLPRIVVQVEEVGAALQQDEGDPLGFQEPAEDPKIGQRRERIHGGPSVRALESRRPAMRQRLEPSRPFPEVAEVAAALELHQGRVPRIRRHLVPWHPSLQQGEDRQRGSGIGLGRV